MTTAEGQYPRIFRRLHGAAGHGSNRFFALLALVVVFAARQKVFRFAKDIWSVLLGAGCLGHGDRIARFQ